MSQLKRRGLVGLVTISVCLGILVGVANVVSAQEANQPPSVLMTSPSDGATYPAGSTVPFSVTAWDDDGAIEAVVFYVGEIWYATQYSAPYEISLPDVLPGVYTLTAVAWDSGGASTATAHTLFVGASERGSNQSPSIAISSPASGMKYPARSSIPFAATAWDPDGTIAAVDFWVDSVLYATQYYGPYGIWLPDASPGSYTLTAVAWDNAGASASDSRTLTVEGSTEGGNQPPSVSVTSPVNGASYPVGATIPFSATASSAAGIAQIELYVDGVWYATAYSSSHSISLPNALAGVYTLTATAWDNNGISAISPGTTLIVGTSSSPPPPAAPLSNQPPVVSLTTPTSGARFTAPASITIGATASDVDGTITQVEFYANGVLIQVDTTSPYSFSWTNVSAGDYSLTAVARDNGGAMTVSSTRDITVIAPGLPSTAVFTPSSNHATAVDRYVFEVFPLGADPTVANPVVTQDLGKPAIINGEITADVSSTILALSPGDYVATVTAIGNGGSAQSAPSPQFRR